MPFGPLLLNKMNESMSIPLLGRKCTLAASRAAS